MATITRLDLANAIKNRFGLTVADSYKMIDIIFDEINIHSKLYTMNLG